MSPVDTFLLLGGGRTLELVWLLLDWPGLLLHLCPCPSVTRIVLSVLGQAIVQGVLYQPLETLESK